jgi:arabinoxylan arabinofuranohydrolase
MTQAFGADPNVLEWEGRLYVYMTADALLNTSGQAWQPGQTVGEHNYGRITSLRVLSTADMVNWTMHPELLRSNITGQIGWINNIWAPGLASKLVDGRMQVFLYFANSGASVGVISADHPLGPWRSPNNAALIRDNTSGLNPAGWPNVVWIFDPAVLVDDDGRAYIYFGGGTPRVPGNDAEQSLAAQEFRSNHPNPRTKRVAELGANMTSLVAGSIRGLEIPFSFEASEMNKINGIYYYSYSSNPQVNHFATRPDDFPAAVLLGDSFAIGYAIGDNPFGPFELKGSILHNPGKMFDMPYNNNHHKMFEFKGNWYIAYHTKILQDAMNRLADMDIDMAYNYRSTSIDKVNIRADGLIDLVNGTRTGVSQIENFDPFQPTIAATMAVMAGINTEEYNATEGRRVRVTNITSGDWIALRGVNFGAEGATKFRCRVVPPTTRGVIQIRQGGLNGPAVGYVGIEPGVTEIEVNLLRTVVGVHDIVFVFYGTGYRFEEWQFIK